MGVENASAMMVERLTDEELSELLEGIGTVPSDAELDIPWPIDGVIHPGITAITGQPSVGKTTLIQSLCRSILDGAPWLGNPVNFGIERRIIFGCEDNGGVQRVRSLFADECGSHRVIPLRLGTWDRPPLTASKLQRWNVGLVVLDSVYSVVEDVNDQASAGAFVGLLRSFGVPVVVIHHEPKGSSTGAAGAQGYLAAYRHNVKVSKRPADGYVGMRLDISGNDVPDRSSFNVRVHRHTLEASPGSAVDPPRARGLPRTKKLSPVERAQRLIAYASSVGVEVTGPDYNASATRLLGGSRGREDPALQNIVASAISDGGLPSIGHQALARLIQGEITAPAEVVEAAS